MTLQDLESNSFCSLNFSQFEKLQDSTLKSHEKGTDRQIHQQSSDYMLTLWAA